MELEEVWKGFFKGFGETVSFWICWVWVEDMDEEVPVFDADHDCYVK